MPWAAMGHDSGRFWPFNSCGLSPAQESGTNDSRAGRDGNEGGRSD